MFSLIHYEFFSHAKSYQNKERKTALNSLLGTFLLYFLQCPIKKELEKITDPNHDYKQCIVPDRRAIHDHTFHIHILLECTIKCTVRL